MLSGGTVNRKCLRYENVKKCVGANKHIKRHTAASLEKCQEICDLNASCVGVLFYVASGQASTNPANGPTTCIELSSIVDTTSCDYLKEQLQLWKSTVN